MAQARNDNGSSASRVIETLFFLVALFFFLYLARYYITGSGGPTLLAIAMVPVAMIVVTFNELKNNDFYPRLSPLLNYLIAAIYIGICITASIYVTVNADAIRTYRSSMWNQTDLWVAGLMVLLILEYARRKFLPLFIINAVLILYCVYGYYVPGMFFHPGLSWKRVLTSMSLEIQTGIYDQLPQLALTLIGSFILVLSLLQGFGSINSLLKGASLLAARSPHLLPQASVLGSLSVATVSGSSAVNAATTGTVTIPSLIRSGFPPANAAAIETASSLGGQLMPPMMGIAAFIMADYLRVSYFEVVARGFGPGLIYYIGVGVAVYLLANRFRRRDVTDVGIRAEPLDFLDKVNIVIYLSAVIGLIYLMGALRMPPMLAAQRSFLFLFIFACVLFAVKQVREGGFKSLAAIRVPLSDTIQRFSTTTAELTLLLCTLSILTATFTITGVPTKIGALMLAAAGGNLVIMLFLAFLFGYLMGMGLPPAPTYIVTAVVIAPHMISAGIDVWVVHFFAFFVSVFGELSPPTSVAAAVTAKIANASFMRTMMLAIPICLPLLTLMTAVFTRPGLVVEPGWAMAWPFTLVLLGTIGLTFSLYGVYSELRWLDIGLRAVLAAASLLALYHPSESVGIMALIPIVGFIVAGLLRPRRKAVLARHQAASA